MIARGVIEALIHCGVRSSWVAEPADFREAERLGLLRHHPCWHVTERGKGVLIAFGEMKGEPAPEIARTHILWVVKPDNLHPNVVAAFNDGFVESYSDDYMRIREELEENYRAWFPQEEEFDFFTTVVEIALPELPSHSDRTTEIST